MRRRRYPPRPETTERLPSDPSPEEIAAAVERFKRRQLAEKRREPAPQVRPVEGGIREYAATELNLDPEWRTA